MSKVRFGLVGTSWWADLMHVPAIQSHPHAELVACCGRNEVRTRDFAEKHAIDQWFLDARDMIAEEQLDAIVIATPENAHHEICLAAADAGLHIMCEKPLAMNLLEAEEMLAAVEEAGVKHLAYFTWRWVPWMRYVEQLIADGYVGEIQESRFSMLGGYGLSREPHWKWDRRTGLGVLGDLGSHAIDWALWLVGPVVDVDASVVNFVDRSVGNGARVDPSNDSAVLSLRFENGSHGVVEASAITHLGEREMSWNVDLRGTQGTLRVSADFENGWRVWGVRVHDEAGELDVPASLMVGVDAEADFSEQVTQIFTSQGVGVRSFVDAIVDDDVVEPSLAEGVAVQRVIGAALRSSRERTRVNVGSVDVAT